MSASVPVSGPSPACSKRWGDPGVVAGLWLLDTCLHVVDQVIFGSWSNSPSMFVSSALYLSGGPVIAALAAAAIAGLRDRTFALATSLLLVDCAATLWSSATKWAFQSSTSVAQVFGWMIVLVAALACGLVIKNAIRKGGNRIRRIAAILTGIIIFAGTPFLASLDDRFLQLSYSLSPHDDAQNSVPQIDEERLWTSQPSLVETALAGVHPARGAAGAAYLITLGAGGSQHLFGREARFAKTALGHAFGAEQRTLVLANDEESLFRIPLAANSNVEAVLAGLGRRADRAHDLVVIYLASHGGRDAELMTDLPNYNDIQAIGAKRLAQELNRSGFRRRVIIVSACYAGTWIKPLATDDTIIIAAARADRSSFGCSDDRELTYFGEAFLRAPVSAKASLAERFNTAKRTVAEWEASSAKLPSEPQAFVGKNMAAVWKSPTSTAATVN